MILDYKNNKEFALANGVMPENSTGETHFVIDKVVRDVTFNNFANLCIEDACFENCIFENCERVSIENCHMEGCDFKNVNKIKGSCTNFNNCTFTGCCSDGPLLVIGNHGCVENCVFDTITTLGDNGYIIYSVYGKKNEVEMVSGCKFIDCQVESEDGKYCYCAYFKPFLSYKTFEIDNVNYENCSFNCCSSIEPENNIEMVGNFISEDD